MDQTLNTGRPRDLNVGQRFAHLVDLSTSTNSAVDVRFAWAVIVGDRPIVNINVGVGPLVPRPGSPAAQLVEDLTANLRPPQSLEGLVARSRRSRWVVLHGNAGSGKSTVLAALVRPELTEGRVPKDFVHAVVQLDSTSTAWWLAEQLAEQFRVALPRYTPAVEACRAVDPSAWDEKSLWEQRVLEPLTLLTRVDNDSRGAGPENQQPAAPEPAARIVLDGWEQVRPEYAADLHRVVHALAHDQHAAVHVIVGARTSTVATDDLLTDAIRLELPAPERDDLIDYLQVRQLPPADAGELAESCARGASAWLLARLIGDTFADQTSMLRAELIRQLTFEPDRHHLIDLLYRAALDAVADAIPGGWADALRPVMAVLAVPGAGPVMPLPMLHAVTAHDDLTPDTVDTALDALGRYLIRISTNNGHELVGLFHPTLAEYLSRPGPHWVDTTNTRILLLDEIGKIAHLNEFRHNNPLARWADQAEVDYLWAAGMPRAAVQAMIRRPLPAPRDNLERWQDAQRRIEPLFQALDSLTLTIRYYIAFYTGQAGHRVEALRLYKELLPDREAVLGPRDPKTLSTRGQVAAYTGATGHLAEALKLYQELLPDREAVLGPHHSATLHTRGQIAAYTGATSHLAEALKLYQELLPDREAVLGHHHPDTLNTRHQIAGYTGETGHPAEALKLYQELLPDLEAVLGASNPDTLTTRHQIAYYTGETGQYGRALELYTRLLPDIEKVLGPTHPDTLGTRHQIALYTGQTGSPAQALELYTRLLPDMESVLGPRHPDTLSTRHQIAYYTGQTGQHLRALELYSQLLVDQKAVLGPQHPQIDKTRHQINMLREASKL